MTTDGCPRACYRLGAIVLAALLAGCGRRQARVEAEDRAVWVYPHRDWVTAVAFTPDGRSVLTASKDKALRRWDLDSGRGAHEVRGGDRVWSIAFDRGGGTIAVAGDSSIRTGPTGRLANLRRAVKAPPFSSFDRVFFLPDGKSLLASPRRVCTYEIATGAKIRCYGRVLLLGLEDIDVSRDGRRVASVRWFSSNIHLLDLASGKSVLLGAHEPVALAVAFSPDGTRIVSGGMDGPARLWDVEARRQVRQFGPVHAEIWAVAMTPDGTRVVTGNGDGTVHVFDTATGKELRQLTGHGAMVLALAVSPDGRYALSGSADKTARLWDLADLNRAPRARVASPPEGVTLQDELGTARNWSDLRRLHTAPHWMALAIVGLLATWLGGIFWKRGSEPRAPLLRSAARAFVPAVFRYGLLYLPAAIALQILVGWITGQPVEENAAGNTVKLALLLAVAGTWAAYAAREFSYPPPPAGRWAVTLIAYPMFYWMGVVPALYLAQYLAGRFGYVSWRREIGTAILQLPVLHTETWPNRGLLLAVVAIVSVVSYRRFRRLVSELHAR